MRGGSLGATCWHFGPLKLRVVWPRQGQPSGTGPLALALNCVSPQRVQFGMYALYSKNKPRSDALMTSYGHAFFKVGEPETVEVGGKAGVP